MEHGHSYTKEREEELIDTTELLLGILDNREIINDQIDASPHSETRSYRGFRVDKLEIPKGMYGAIQNGESSGATFDASFSKQADQPLTLEELKISPDDGRPSTYKKAGNSGRLETGSDSFWTKPKGLDLDCLRLALPQSSENLGEMTVDDYASLFSVHSPNYDESREFLSVDDEAIFSVESNHHETSDDSIDVLRIARLDRYDDHYIGTRLVLIESLNSRSRDAEGVSVDSKLYLEEVYASKSENNIFEITKSKCLIEIDELSISTIDAMDKDHKGDILDALYALEKTAQSKLKQP